MSRLITSLFSDPGNQVLLHWETDGVLFLVLLTLLMIYLSINSQPRRKTATLLTILFYGTYLLLLLLFLGGRVLWEQYAKT